MVEASLVATGTKRSALAAGLIAAALGLASCGDESSEVEDTILSYAAAIREGDWEQACSLFTEASRAELAREAETNGRDEPTCEGELAGDLGGEEADYQDVEVNSVDVNGDGATASVTQAGEEGEASLAKEDGDWRIVF